jgi:hypothetical protein
MKELNPELIDWSEIWGAPQAVISGRISPEILLKPELINW